MAKSRDNYHHGDLRQAVLDLARKRIESDGVDAFSIRSLATEIGVAHRAIYNHFADKDALLSAIAAIGYRDLVNLLSKAENAEQHVRTYATFALEHRHLYAIMMNRSYAQFENVPDLRAGADSVIAVSLALLAPDHGSDVEKRREVMRHWMLVHGGVSLHAAGALRSRADDDFISELLAVAGLGPGQDEPPQPLWTTSKDPQS